MIDLKDEDFTLVLPPENKIGKKIRDPVSKHFFYEHKSTKSTGITVYRCVRNRMNKCEVRAFLKSFNGVDYIVVDRELQHLDCKIDE